MGKIKFDELTKETKAMIVDAYECADLGEEEFNKIKEEGLDAETWRASPLNLYLGGELPEEFQPKKEAISDAKDAEKPEDDTEEWYSRLQRTLNIFDEKVLRVEVRKRKEDGGLSYLRGGSLKWNPFTMNYTDLLDTIAKKFREGEYHLTFKSRNKKLKPFTRFETIEMPFDARMETAYPPQIITEKESFDPEKLTTSMANIFVNIFKDFRMEMKEMNSAFQSQMAKNQSDTVLTVKELANAIKYSAKNQPENVQQNANMDILNALDKLTEISARINKPQQPQPQVDIQAAVSRGIKDHMSAMEYGMKLAQVQEPEEEEFEPEEPKKEEPKPTPPADDIDFDQPIEGIFSDVVKSELTGNVRDVIRGAIKWLKDKAEAQPAEVQQEISKQKVPEHVEQMVKVGGIETTKGDLKILMYYINEVEKRLKTQADMDIVRWLRGQLAPDILPCLAGINKQYLTLAINSLKPSLAPEIDRILRIIKMTTVDIKPATP